MPKGSSFSTSSPVLVIWYFKNDNHPGGCEVVSNCGFNLHFLVTNDGECLFICLEAIFISSLEKCLFKFFASILIRLFVFLFWGCKGPHIIAVRPLLDARFVNIFSHFMSNKLSFRFICLVFFFPLNFWKLYLLINYWKNF